MPTQEFDRFDQLDRRYVEAFREFVRQAMKSPNLEHYSKEASKLLHMHDRQLWQNIKIYNFMYWAMYYTRENLRRDRMTPVPSVSDDSEDAEAG
jgi:hypothetical protein